MKNKIITGLLLIILVLVIIQLKTKNRYLAAQNREYKAIISEKTEKLQQNINDMEKRNEEIKNSYKTMQEQREKLKDACPTTSLDDNIKLLLQKHNL